jgi:SAM-dependent methyltransferase
LKPARPEGGLTAVARDVQRLHLGCGHAIKAGWVNLDSARLPGVDVVHDVEQFPWPFEDESFDHIAAFQLLEHVEYIPVLREAHRILRAGGTFEISVPHFTSRNNWADPTHKKLFSIRTFEFFVRDSRYNRDYYFDFAFRGISRQRLVFEKRWLFYNHLVEPLVNLHPKIAVLYEATLLRSLFPAESVSVVLAK